MGNIDKSGPGGFPGKLFPGSERVSEWVLDLLSAIPGPLIVIPPHY